MEMRDRSHVAEFAAVEHHVFVFAWRQFHPFVVLVNLGWVLRPDFGGAIARNVEQARMRMRDAQATLFNAVAEDHSVQSHGDSFRYCA
jgi:hypothetical protein